jgi:hypothetical protein
MSIAELRCVTQLLIFLRHRGITTRHLAFASAVALFLWASYHTVFSPHSLAFPERIYAPVTPNTTPEEWRNRAEQVKAAFVHAYHGYEEHAWRWDELRPMTNQSQNKYDFIPFGVAFKG